VRFEAAVAIVLELEGGGEYVNHASDPGGPTRWGISQKAYPDLNIRELTEAQAREIYRRDYWDKVGCDFLPERLRLAVFDCAVNQGAGMAVVLLQRALDVKDDGVMGPVTIRELKRQSPRRVLVGYLTQRALHYVKNKRFDVFGKGWLSRLIDVAITGAEG
jgi:lysozyme family protein